jgi:Tfp pilus assembly protein PilN
MAQLGPALLSLFEPGWGLRRPVAVVLTSFADDLPRDGSIAGRRVTVRLPSSAVLHREFALPAKARRQAAAAIATHIRQTTPMQGRGLHWKAGPPRVEGDRLVFDVLLAKADQMSGLADRIARASGRLVAIDVEGPRAVRLYDDPDISTARRRWVIGAGLLMGLGVAAQLGLIELKIREGQRANAEVSASIAALEDRLVEARAKLDAEDAEAKGLRADLATLRLARSRLPLLVSLTKALPDSVWVSELTADTDRITLSGFVAGDVTVVTDTLDAIDGVDAVTLDAPVTVDSLSGQTRFQLTLRLKSDLP